MSDKKAIELLQEAILFHDYRDGSLVDKSGNGNDGTPSDCYFTNDGVRLEGVTGDIVVADSPELQSTEGAFVMLADFDTQTDYQGLFSKADAGGQQYDCYTTSTTVTLSADSSAQLVMDLIGKKCLGINFANNEKPKGYLEGDFSADGNVVLPITAKTADLIIGNYYSPADNTWLRSNVKAVLIFDRQLTATEHSILYGYLSKLKWPKKTFTNIHDPKIFKCENIRESVNAQTEQLENSPFKVQSGSFKIDSEKNIECVTMGTISIPTSYFHQTPMEAGYGEWSFDVDLTGRMQRMLIASKKDVYTATGQNGYLLEITASTGYIVLFRIDNGSATILLRSELGHYASGTGATLRILRSASGSFSAYMDEVLIPTITGSNPIIDNTYSVSDFDTINLLAGDKIKYNSIVKRVI